MIKLGVNNIYKHYRTNMNGEVNKQLFTLIIKDFNESIVHLIATENMEFKIPFNLGIICIRKKRKIIATKDGQLNKKVLRPDWKATKELWETNEVAKKNKQLVYHVQKYYYRWYWDKTLCFVKNQGIIRFTPSRKNKRLIPKVLKEYKDIDFYED